MRERYVDYIVPPSGNQVDGFLPDAGLLTEGHQVLLGDFLPVEVGATPYTARGCALIDKGRQEELGGQYVQRTNNYRRDYPDNCSAPLSDFVGAIYKPKDGVGLQVPCDGAC